MAELPAGVEVVFDQAFDNDSQQGSEADGSAHRNPDYHREQYPAYVPPHARGHNVQPGDSFVNFKNRKPSMGEDPDKVEGAANDKFMRLKLNVNFAVSRKVLDHLKPQFPGIYFHSSDNGNHDHPISHVVTQIGTRFLQRRIPKGSNILDVYGNPNACERFNRSQVDAPEPKVATALVNNFGGADFIREVNKWGPVLDEEGTERYHKGTLKKAISDGLLLKYDVLQMIHTLYYEDLATICEALHAPCDSGKKRRILALVHRHTGSKGSINGGEQTYVTNGLGLVKQTNVLTNSTYVHNNVSSWLFAEKKEWFGPGRMMYADKGRAEVVSTQGVVWDVHLVNEETWIVEIVACSRNERDVDDESTDFQALWDQYEEMMTLDSLPEFDNKVVNVGDSSMILPTADGKFVELDLCCKPLLQKLRATCVGRPRDGKLLSELVRQAQHLVNPSMLFGDKPGMACPEEKIYDHALAAWLSDAEREDKLHQAVDRLQPLLMSHARALKMGQSFKDFSFRDLVGWLRASLTLARAANSTLRSKDAIDYGLGTLQGWLD